jgi:hypothetical protein
MGTALAVDAGPSLKFPAAARERIAIASYPFRDFIAGSEDKPGTGKMELKEFAAHVGAKFNIKKIEPWSAHFRSLEKAQLEELRAAVAKAGGAIVNGLMRRWRSARRACGRTFRKRRIRNRTWNGRWKA